MIKARIFGTVNEMQVEIELEDTTDYNLRTNLDQFMTWIREQKTKEVKSEPTINTDQDIPF